MRRARLALCKSRAEGKMVEEIGRADHFFEKALWRHLDIRADQKKRRAPASRLPETGGAIQRATESM